jgi:hypothetical protein
MDKGKEYRKYAEESRKLAATLKSGGGREHLLEIASEWDRLADEREHRFTRDIRSAWC